MRKKGSVLMEGTVLAGDGIVYQCHEFTEKDRGDLPHGCFMNRKGFSGLIAQAFCDAYTRFRFFECHWPGGTNDITAYKQTLLYALFKDGSIPECHHAVLDEAYSSISGNQHLCPFSRHQLRKAYKLVDKSFYCKMKSFNNALSSQRITIERAFGMKVRKWGILWKAHL